MEPLVRIGVEYLVLAEPGVYDLGNLNRQRASLADVGRNKADALAQRVQLINPYAEVSVVRGGVTGDTLETLLNGVAVVIDGVDVTAAEAGPAEGAPALACRSRRSARRQWV